MATLSAFAKYVRPEVALCPEIVVLDAILQAGIDFCKRARVTSQIVSVTTVMGTPDYALLPDGSDEQPEEILYVRRGECHNLTASSEHDFERHYLNDQVGTPEYYYLDTNHKLVLGRKPSESETLSVKFRTVPKQDSRSLPDILFDRYSRDIAAGAKAMLMMMKDKAWTDLQQAAINQAKFEQAIDEANLRRAKGASKKPLRTVSHYF